METYLQEWVRQQAEVTRPDNISWMYGSEEEARNLIYIGLTKEKIAGNYTFLELNHKIFPNSYLHPKFYFDAACY